MTINATCTERACRWLVIVSLLLCSISAKAAYEKIDGVWINITSETNLTAAVVYAPSGYSGNIIIPETIVRLGKTYRVTSIASSAFDGDVDVTSVFIPESVTSIGDYAFRNCSGVRTINFPSKCSAGLYTFQGCTGELTVSRNLPGVEVHTNPKIFGYFYGSRFTSVKVDDNVTRVGNFAFWNCNTIQSVILSETVTAIGGNAFYGCSSLASIILPDGVTSIGGSAFEDCSGLTSITSMAVVPPTIGNAYTFYNVDKSIPVYVPAASLDDYKAAEYWKDFFNILPIKRETSIVDGEDFEHGQDELFDEITYTRTFNNTNWQALYVPFEIPVTAEFLADFEVAYINNVHQRDYDDDGVTEQTEVEAFKITRGTLRANYPYLIRAKEAGKKIITVTNTTLYATEENSIDCASVFRTYTFTGTYKRLSSVVLPQSEGYYALSGGKWKPIATGSSLGAFRFYLQVKSRGGDAATKALSIRMRIFDEYGNEEITEVEDIEANLPAEDVVYDLHGRRVEVPGKGVYIVNGKKMVF